MLRKTKNESVERKSKPTYEVKPYVVVATGERGNDAIQTQRKVNSRCHWEHVDNLKRFNPQEEDELEKAQEQADGADIKADQEYVYHVEKILCHVGTQQLDLGLGDQRELLVKWTGWDTPTWETVVDIDNSQMCKEYFSQYKKLSPAERHSMRMLAETYMSADDELGGIHLCAVQFALGDQDSEPQQAGLY